MSKHPDGCPMCRLEVMEQNASVLVLNIKQLIHAAEGRGKPAHRSQIIRGMKRILTDAEAMDVLS